MSAPDFAKGASQPGSPYDSDQLGVGPLAVEIRPLLPLPLTGSTGEAVGGILAGALPDPAFNATVAGNGLGIDAGHGILSVNVDNTTVEVSADNLRLKDLGVTDAKVAAANKDGAAATPSLRTLGTGSAQACAGNDARLSDGRTPSGSAGGDLTGSYPNPTIKAGVSLAGVVSLSGKLALLRGSDLNGSTGAITPNASLHRITGGGVDISTINNGADGQLIVLLNATGGGFNLVTGGNIDRTVAFPDGSCAVLIYNSAAAKWHVIVVG